MSEITTSFAPSFATSSLTGSLTGSLARSLARSLTRMSLWLDRRTASERGASLVEYSLLIALIAVVVIGSVAMFGGSVNGQFSTVASEVAG